MEIGIMAPKQPNVYGLQADFFNIDRKTGAG